MLFNRRGLMLAAAATLAACATPEPEGPPRKESVYAVTNTHELIRFNAGQPRRILDRKALVGLDMNDRLVGIDFRVARGQLFGLAASGRLYTIETATGRLTRVGQAAPAALSGQRFGIDFSPTVDRLRVLSDSGQNLRLHPDTGAVAGTDPAPVYAAGDSAAGKTPRLTAAGYTYNKRDDKITTNYALDIAQGTLVTMGSKEGATPAVAPNTGQLFTVGSLGVSGIEDASFDIADTDNSALITLRSGGATRLYLLDLGSGRARLLGTVGGGGALVGIAIEP